MRDPKSRVLPDYTTESWSCRQDSNLHSSGCSRLYRLSTTATWGGRPVTLRVRHGSQPCRRTYARTPSYKLEQATGFEPASTRVKTSHSRPIKLRLLGTSAGIRTRVSGLRGQRSVQLNYRSILQFGGVAENRTRNSCLQGRCDPNFTTTPLVGSPPRIRTGKKLFLRQVRMPVPPAGHKLGTRSETRTLQASLVRTGCALHPE